MYKIITDFFIFYYKSTQQYYTCQLKCLSVYLMELFVCYNFLYFSIQCTNTMDGKNDVSNLSNLIPG